jgi:hypothetical protein
MQPSPKIPEDFQRQFFIYRGAHHCPCRKMDLRRQTFYLRKLSDFACLLKLIYGGEPLKRSASENGCHFWRQTS